MKIQLKENIVPIEIGNLHFEIDADNIKSHLAISEFIQNYSGNRIISEKFIEDCKSTINVILGDDAYNMIFKKDDLKPYYVILQLADVLKDNLEANATTEQMKKREQDAEKELKKVQELVKGMSDFNNQLDYTKNKYKQRDGNHVANKKRPSNKNRNRIQ